MSSNFTKLLIKESIRKISKHKTKKSNFNKTNKSENIYTNKKCWTMSKEKRLDTKKSWI